jgi:hypothetical protein
MDSVASLDHPYVQGRDNVDATCAQAAHECVIHRVLIDVEARRHQGSGSV